MEETLIRKLKADLEVIYRDAIEAVSPRGAVRKHCSREGDFLLAGGARYRLDGFERIIVVGAGKATAPMAAAMEELLGDRISGGIVCVKEGYGEPLEKIRILEASHPVPDRRGRNAAESILRLLAEAGPCDLVISLLSGGGSALLPLPPEGVSLEDERAVTAILLKCGAPIGEMNALRKHCSLIKGGFAARAAYPATVLNLMISDVVGDDPSVIASGPFVPDDTTLADVMATIRRYGIEDRLPGAVLRHFREGAAETPKSGDPCFERVTNLVIASNMLALQAGKTAAERLGYTAMILSSSLEGDAAECAAFHAGVMREILATGNPLRPPCCLLSGGETTVRVAGDGLGGRNMEFALRAAPHIRGLPALIASLGTDGTDGPTDAAGAFVTGDSQERAAGKGLEIGRYAERNDSYHFFRELGDLIVTGPTKTNVMDLRVILVPALP